jgi:NAD+ kinase
MKIAIHGRSFNESARPFIESMFSELARRKIDVQLSATFRSFLDSQGVQHFSNLVYGNPDELCDARLVASMGGDGTLLETISHVGKRRIPVIGINVGRLGFLATVSPERISDMIEALENNQYKIDERTLVKVESNIDLFRSE